MNTPSTPAGREPLFPLTYTREQIRDDVCNIFLFESRRACHIYGASMDRPAFVSDLSFYDWFNQDLNPKDIDITYDKIRNFDLALAIEDYFDYGFYAVTGTRTESMKYESIHTWFGYFLQDLSKSAYGAEWESYGAAVLDSAKRCLYVCELANARRLIEGKELFFYFGSTSKDEDSRYNELSIRNLAMLAGMEELSLRSAISRKTAPILEIKKEDRRTYIEPEVAKNWLIAKGRYQPVLIGRRSAELDLATTRFDSISEFQSMLEDRLAFVGDRLPDRDVLKSAMNEVLSSHNVEYLYALDFDDLINDALIDAIAVLLELPADLLKIRSKEAALKSRISSCEQALKKLQKS